MMALTPHPRPLQFSPPQAAACASAPRSSTDDGLRPRWYIYRGSYATPLIPADELPVGVEVENLSRTMTLNQVRSMECLGEIPPPTASYQLVQGTFAHQTTIMPFTGRQLNTAAFDSNSVAPALPSASDASASRFQQPWRRPAATFSGSQACFTPASSAPNSNPPEFSMTPPVSATASPVPTRSSPHAFVGTTRRPLPPSGREPDQGRKRYCTHWIRTGECDYTQQGCLYIHEMPDRSTLEAIGFRSVPRWWQELEAERRGERRTIAPPIEAMPKPAAGFAKGKQPLSGPGLESIYAVARPKTISTNDSKSTAKAATCMKPPTSARELLAVRHPPLIPRSGTSSSTTGSGAAEETSRAATPDAPLSSNAHVFAKMRGTARFQSTLDGPRSSTDRHATEPLLLLNLDEQTDGARGNQRRDSLLSRPAPGSRAAQLMEERQLAAVARALAKLEAQREAEQQKGQAGGRTKKTGESGAEGTRSARGKRGGRKRGGAGGSTAKRGERVDSGSE